MANPITQEALNLFMTFTNLMFMAKTLEAETLLEQKLLPFLNTQLTELWASIE